MGFIQREASEGKEAAVELGGILKRHDYKKSLKSIFSLKAWGLKLGIIIIIVGSTTLSIYHKQIVSAFEPHKEAITNNAWSWVVPVLLLILVSFPPLFGHEVIILVVGLIWGLGIGFAIASAGTFLGEMACFIAFKYYFIERAKKVEEESLLYGALARLMREGGLGMLVLVRFSVLPGHVVSAIQSTVGTNIFYYGIAVVLSLPKQFAIVYLGVIFGQTSTDTTGSALAKQKWISLAVFAITALVSLFAFFFIYTRARRFYRIVEEERRLKGLEEEEGGGGGRIKEDDNGEEREGYGGGYNPQQQQSQRGKPREGWTGFDQESRNEADYSYSSNPNQNGRAPIYDHLHTSLAPGEDEHGSFENDIGNQPSRGAGGRGYSGAGGSGRDGEARELSVSRERLLEEDRLEAERRKWNERNQPVQVQNQAYHYQPQTEQYQQPQQYTQQQQQYYPPSQLQEDRSGGVVNGSIPYQSRS